MVYPAVILMISETLTLELTLLPILTLLFLSFTVYCKHQNYIIQRLYNSKAFIGFLYIVLSIRSCLFNDLIPEKPEIILHNS